ncbi:MAG: hypothetical protein HY960_00460 [Ignavibacteriae bacterium]|nr:hypothetical protein [Ignavibacteriota bacterium]
MNTLELIIQNKTEFLSYLKSKFNLIHNSNIFLRDLHYGLMFYTKETMKKKLKYFAGEELAKDFASELVKQGIFSAIDHQSWRLNYPEFALPRIEKKAP